MTDPRDSDHPPRPGRPLILLVDMDAFFSSVEQAHHPRLRGRPVIVCGDPDRRGVVTAASYEARPFGVRAGMPLAEARRLCPQAAYVEGNPEKYVSISLELLQLYLSYTPDVEPFSVDEAFLGLGTRVDRLEAAAAVAREIQEAISRRFGLGASIGAGVNKLVAKMAAGVNKPRGLTALDEAGFQRIFWRREIQDLWGVGPKLAARMRSLGISTVGELAHAPVPILRGAFGIIGPQLREAAWGRDETPLVPYHQGVDPKSMGHEVTLPEDTTDPGFVQGLLLKLSDQVARRLRVEGYLGNVVEVKLRNDRFETRVRQRALGGFTDDPLRVFTVARGLCLENWSGERLRLIGVSVSGLERRAGEGQSELFTDAHRRHELRSALDRVRDRLGEASLVPAGTLVHRRELGHVPFGAVGPRTGRPAAAGEAPSRTTPASPARRPSCPSSKTAS